MDEAAKKAILRHFPYGLYVVTVAHDGEDHGMTANWITQAAFEPPMVVVAIENTSKTIAMVRDSHHFAINLLLTGQRDLAGKLGRNSDQAPQKLKGLKTKPAPVSGVPVLVDSLGWVECRVVATHPRLSTNTGTPDTGAGFVLSPLSFCGAWSELRPNLPARSRWPVNNRLIAKWCDSRTIPIVLEVFSMATATMGGSNAAWVIQLAVMPWSSPSWATVTTHRP